MSEAVSPRSADIIMIGSNKGWKTEKTTQQCSEKKRMYVLFDRKT